MRTSGWNCGPQAGFGPQEVQVFLEGCKANQLVCRDGGMSRGLVDRIFSVKSEKKIGVIQLFGRGS